MFASTLTTALAFFFAIFIIVAIHEFGHYLAMRLIGVRVLTFSIGFGPRLAGWRDRSGTDFIISALPLGGYVKPLDRRDSEVDDSNRHEEFSGKPAWQRVVTYAAGPAANLLLAVLLYWLILLNGETGRIPVVAEPTPGTPAAQAGFRAGDEIIAIDGHETASWQRLGTVLIRFVGEARELRVSLKAADGSQRDVWLPAHAWAEDPEANPFETLGLIPQTPQAVVGELTPGGAAQRAGMLPGDRVLTANDVEVADWNQWVSIVQAHPEQPLTLRLERDSVVQRLTLVPDAVTVGGERIGRAGVGIAGVRQIHYGPVAAVPEAGRRLWQQSTMILSAIGKLFTGELSVKTLGGPLTIAKVAGDTAALGIVTFMLFLAFFSVSLGVINLLPVPMLDGGWIVFGLIEMIIGRELPEKFLMSAQQVGLVLVIGLMVLAVYNDILRFFV
ncbi:MAG: RIP metalloprotease RseP [Gammaproteobacteria bacterium HGW-Gammaproteobacteria-14]|nr:MAG: RIP metalloprotease RseP [Gammaproteobacteria bacterium HGW-Gammaproteobacteria-14]